MDNEDPEEGAATVEHPDGSRQPAPAPVSRTPISRNETRLRRLSGRAKPYEGPIVAIARGWVSRDRSLHMFAARFLDFAVLTPDHLVLCSTGFFSRRPRRKVLREPLARLEVVGLGTEPFRAVRVVGTFSRPIRIELPSNDAGHTFARELLARTRPAISGGHDPNLPQR
jgi:hypothetical protein